MELRRAVLDTNPWWNNSFFDLEINERDAFRKIEPFIEKKQIIGVYGLRRTGKSFLLFYLIKKLLDRGEDPKGIFYFSFDAYKDISVQEVMDECEKLAGRKPKFVFFDEIQKVGSWADQIKRLYDFSKIKIILTGSAAIALKKSSKESLSGRIYEFEMDPLSFTEYLAFKKISIDAIHEEQIKKNIEHYLMTNGFPELIEEKDAFFIKKYIKESIIDKAIYQDIPERFKISDPSMLESIINIIISNPGMVIDKNELSKRLGVFRTTISKYLFYLESSFLIKKLYNYSRNASTSEKKLKKYYTGFVSLSLGDKDDLTYFSKAVENKIILGLKAKYFWRNPQHKEIDAVLTNPLRAIESKYSNQEQKTFLLDFMEEYNLTKGIIITKNIQKTEKIKGKTIQHLPFWKWLLEEQKD